MRGLVIRGPGELGIEELEPLEPGADEVRVRSMAVGICGTDLEILNGQVSEQYVTYPVVPGHEWSGVVEAVGSAVAHVKPGDRVISEGIVACGRCESCRNGLTNLCLNYDQLGFTRRGGAAEQVVAPASGIHRIPDSLSFEAAVLVEPAATVLRGVMRTPFKPGMTAAVIGPGTLGLLTVQVLQAFGAAEIILIGTRDNQLEFGRTLGATRWINNRTDDPQERIKAWTNGQGVDLVVETSGSVEAVASCFGLCKPGGHVVLEGVAGSDKQLTLPSDLIMLQDLTVHGIFSYTTQSWSKVLQLLAAGLLDFESLVTHRFKLEEYEQAFESIRRKSGVTAKVVMVHGEGKPNERLA